MKTNLKLVLEQGRTSTPTVVLAPEVRRRNTRAEVLLKGNYSLDPGGRPQVLVSMDSGAVSRRIAVQEVLGTRSSTTGKDTSFGGL